MTDARTVVLKPGDTLMIANLGQTAEDALDALHEGLERLRCALGLSSVVVFEADVDTTAVAPIEPLPDAVVLRVFDRESLTEHHEVLAAWVRANGIDPATVALEWLSIEQAGDRRLIRYPAFRQTPEGRHLRDPRSRGRSWTVERVVPLVIDLDWPASTDVDGQHRG